MSALSTRPSPENECASRLESRCRRPSRGRILWMSPLRKTRRFAVCRWCGGGILAARSQAVGRRVVTCSPECSRLNSRRWRHELRAESRAKERQGGRTLARNSRGSSTSTSTLVLGEYLAMAMWRGQALRSNLFNIPRLFGTASLPRRLSGPSRGAQVKASEPKTTEAAIPRIARKVNNRERLRRAVSCLSIFGTAVRWMKARLSASSSNHSSYILVS